MSDALRKAAEQALSILQDIKPGNMTPMAEDAWVRASQKLYAALAEPEAAQTPPPRFSELLEIYRQVHPVERRTKGNPYARAVESALRAKLGIKDQEGGAA